MTAAGTVRAMDPWSPTELTVVFGKLPADEWKAIQVLLSEIDRLLRGGVSDLDCGFVYTTSTSSRQVQAELAANRDIHNEDGSWSRGALYAEVRIERLSDHDERWSAWAYVDQNCNRLSCPEDPHNLHNEEDFVGSPLEAAELAVVRTRRLVDWLRARQPDELGSFVHP